ncbi:TetR/AcrR family transcriptional regulator [Curvivirga aplysinae]|uniref:TetR/AcrR family transcriptional regulator n=1 Tax=Curvivirga aplysinae TaxID=2529852 RepID=UPI001C3FB8B2|nr:TetR/AcrR family transcriptional regulator [Curvivirga aplysinae]
MTEQNDIRGNTKTTKQEWLKAAQLMLINDGVERVKIDRLAKVLDVTRGGFYWFFKSRQDLLDQLVDDWADKDSDPLISSLEESTPAMDRLITFAKIIIDEDEYNPALDMAIREWARTNENIQKKVTLIDQLRMTALGNIFKELGEDIDSALIRARIYYFHQIGYYAMGIKETSDQRKKYLPIYFKQLTGYDLPKDFMTK